VSFNRDGTSLASGSDDGTLRLWDATTGALRHNLAGHRGPVGSVAFSPDGARLASGADDWTVRLWDTTSGTPVFTLNGHVGRVLTVAFSPDGTRLASAGWDTFVRVWDVQTGTAVRALVGHTNWVRNVRFSPDGTRLASEDDSGRCKVWDLTTGKEIVEARLPAWLTNAHSASPDRDGSCLAVPHFEGTILLVKPRPPDEFERGYREATARPDPEWHWRQARQYEHDQLWFAVRFHCQQVLKYRPNDAGATTLLAAAEEHLPKP
jgi:WD40 repeat protein